MGLALDMALKFYTSVAKGLKLKVRKFWELTPIFVEITGEKLVGGAGGGEGEGGLCGPPILNRVKFCSVKTFIYLLHRVSVILVFI